MSKIAVFFPGIGYHTDKPLLYYSRKIALSKGYTECINLKFTLPDMGNLRGDKDKLQKAFELLYSQAKDQLSDIDWSKYDDILFISKSIGTVICACYGDYLLSTQGFSGILRQILYTPLEATFSYKFRDAVAFIGTADPWSHVPTVVDLSENAGVPIHIYPDCNHSLETTNTLQNLDILKDLMLKTSSFIE